MDGRHIPSVLVILLLVSAVPISIPGAGSLTGSRAGGPYELIGPINVTQNTVGCSGPDMAFDASDNILMVYVCDNHNITYSVMAPDHTTILAPKILSNSSDGTWAQPRIVVTTNGTVQIVYGDETESSPTMQFHDRLVLDLMATNVAKLIGGGDEDILADHEGNVYGYDFFSRPGGGPQPPEPGGPLTMTKVRGNGTVLWSHKVGYNYDGSYNGDFAIGPDGDVHLVYLMNYTIMNYTRVDGAGNAVIADMTIGSLDLDDTRYLDVAIAVDGNGTAHVFDTEGHDEGQYGPNYVEYNHLAIKRDGTVQKANINTSTDGYGVVDMEAAGPDPQGHIMLGESWWFTVAWGSGGNELSNDQRTRVVDLKGTIVEPVRELIRSCPDYFGVMEMNRSGAFHFATQNRTCHGGQSGGGPPPDYISDIILYNTDIGQPLGYDLAVVNSSVPSGILEGDRSDIGITVINHGPARSTDVITELRYRDNMSIIGTESHGPLDSGASWAFSMAMDGLTGPTNISIHIVPLGTLDADLSNNWANITITPRKRPDVGIVANETVIAPAQPLINGQMWVNVTIRNDGDVEAQANFTLEAFSGPSLVVVPAHGRTVSSSFWTPTVAGNYTWMARLSDISPTEMPGRQGDNTATINFTVTGAGPVVLITSPVNGSIIHGPTNITGTAVDPDGDPVQVSLNVDGIPTGVTKMASGGGFVFLWDFGPYPEGPHNITVLGHSIHGSYNDTIHVTVQNPTPPQNNPPIIWDWTPANMSAHIGCVRTANVSVQLWDVDGDRLSLDWYLDGTLVRADRDIDPNKTWLTLTIDGDALTVGHHVLKVTVGDGDPMANSSYMFDVTVASAQGCGTPPPVNPPPDDEPQPSPELEMGWPICGPIVLAAIVIAVLGFALELRRRGMERKKDHGKGRDRMER